jgi:hypothetical protein
MMKKREKTMKNGEKEKKQWNPIKHMEKQQWKMMKNRDKTMKNDAAEEKNTMKHDEK